VTKSFFTKEFRKDFIDRLKSLKIGRKIAIRSILCIAFGLRIVLRCVVRSIVLRIDRKIAIRSILCFSIWTADRV